MAAERRGRCCAAAPPATNRSAYPRVELLPPPGLATDGSKRRRGAKQGTPAAATAPPLRREEQIAVRPSRIGRVRGRPSGSGGGSEGGSRGHSAPLKAGGYARRFIPQTYTFSPSQPPLGFIALSTYWPSIRDPLGLGLTSFTSVPTSLVFDLSRLNRYSAARVCFSCYD